MYGLNFKRRQIPQNVLAEPDFLNPDADIKIWRYMDLPKFISLLKSEALFLSNHQNFNDPFEGSFPKCYKATREEIKEKYDLPDAKEETIHNYQKEIRKYTYLNCWHMSNYESAAMWHIYGKSNKSIAIQSEYRKLVELASKHDGLLISGVGYIDYDEDCIPYGNTCNIFIFKRKSFDYEKELRLLYQDTDALEKGEELSGIEFGFDLEALIEKCHLAPNASDLFVDIVKSLLDKYSLDLEVKKSSLDNTLFK